MNQKHASEHLYGQKQLKKKKKKKINKTLCRKSQNTEEKKTEVYMVKYAEK